MKQIKESILSSTHTGKDAVVRRNKKIADKLNSLLYDNNHYGNEDAAGHKLIPGDICITNVFHICVVINTDEDKISVYDATTGLNNTMYADDLFTILDIKKYLK